MTLRVLIVDDEPLGRRGVRARLDRAPDVEVVGECASGREAVIAIREAAPDVVFLDVQMPGLDGFGVVEAVGPEAMPVTVFVTAYDEHAVRAFEAEALDYLLKPIRDDRFEAALDRTRRRAQRDRAARTACHADPQRFAYKDGATYGLLDPEEIVWAEAQDVYVCLHTGRGSVLIREPLYSVEGRLPPGQFVRVHRSAVVNVDRVARVVPGRQGRATLHLDGGAEVPMSRTYRADVMAVLHDGLAP